MKSFRARLSAAAFFVAAIIPSSLIYAAAQVTSIELVSSVRTGRTGFDYTYSIRGQNGSPALTDARATVTSTVANVVVIDNTVTLGALGESTAFTSQDTFVVRVDRTVAFDPSVFRWTVTGTPVVPPTGGPGMLPGVPTANAVASAIDSLDESRAGVPRTQVTVDAEGNPIVRTRLVIRMTSTATVGQINTLLGTLRGEIISMTRGSPYLVVAIPDPQTLSALDAIVLATQRSPGVESAEPDGLPVPQTLPPGNISSNPTLAANQLAIHAPAVWSLRNYLNTNQSSAPVLVIADYFGKGAPSTQYYNITVPRPGDFAITAPNSDGHGYHVLGIATARIDDSDSVAGVYAGRPVEVRAVDAYGSNGFEITSAILHEQIARVLADLRGRKVVFNTSLGIRDRDLAFKWIYEIESRSLQGAFLHVTSAGNSGVSTESPTVWPNSFQVGIRRWSNGFIVENRSPVRLGSTFLYQPSACLTGSSNSLGTISAVGQGVLSYDNGAGHTVTLNGTSMATPQVAGAALNLFALRDDWNTSDVARAISLSTRRPQDECATTARGGAPFLDAYQAVLRTDRNLTLAGAPVRRTLLDRRPTPTGDGAFHENDLEVLRRDMDFITYFSESDLNGDGATGLSGYFNEPHDLDADGVISLEPLQLRMPNGMTYYFDERSISDKGILCWYAHKLYGDTAADLSARTAAVPSICPAERVLSLGHVSIDWRFANPACGARGEPCSRESFDLPYNLSVASQGDYVSASASTSAGLSVSGSGNNRLFSGTLRSSLSARSDDDFRYEVFSQFGAGWTRTFEVTRPTRFTFAANLQASRAGEPYNCRVQLAAMFRRSDDVSRDVLGSGLAGARCTETEFPWGNTTTTQTHGVIQPGTYIIWLRPGSYGTNPYSWSPRDDVGFVQTVFAAGLTMDGQISLQLTECPLTGVCQP
jgi:hypothetical protein